MNPDLAKALGEIEKGAEQRLQERRMEFKKLQQQMGTEQRIMEHTEKKEEPADDEPVGQQTKPMEEQDDTTTTEEEGVPTGSRKWKTPSIAAMKQLAIQSKIKEQQRQYDEATKCRHATNKGLGDLDLKEAMEKMADDAEKTTATATETTMVMTMATASTPRVVTAEVYSKPYTSLQSREANGAQPEVKEGKT